MDFGDGSTYDTYRNVSLIILLPLAFLSFVAQLVILSVIGVPGAILAGWMVELPKIGRNGTLAISTGKPTRYLASEYTH